jgi:hypothetical protein
MVMNRTQPRRDIPRLPPRRSHVERTPIARRSPVDRASGAILPNTPFS